jgi:uncharacterized protein
MAMRAIRVERQNGEVLCERCLVASSFRTRLRGLVGRRQLPETEGLLIRPAGSVHTFFMRFPIDVVFLDRDDSVLKVVPSLQPRRLAGARRARRALELTAGACARAGLAVGESLELLPVIPKERAA